MQCALWWAVSEWRGGGRRKKTRTFIKHHEHDVHSEPIDIQLCRPALVPLPTGPETSENKAFDEIVDAGPLELEIISAVVLNTHEECSPEVIFEMRRVEIAATKTFEGDGVAFELGSDIGCPRCSWAKTTVGSAGVEGGLEDVSIEEFV